MSKEITLTALNSGYATNPDQGVIAYPVSIQLPALEQTLVDVVEHAVFRTQSSPFVASYDNASNCLVSIILGGMYVTGSTVGGATVDFTLEDNEGNQSIATLTLGVVASDGVAEVTLTDVTSTGFDDVLIIGDTIAYTTTTAISEALVLVNQEGRVQVTGTYTSGDSFTYQINSGTPQTYTFE